MPSLDDTSLIAAPPEEVWKLLYDPTCFSQWWAGGEYPAPQHRRTSHGDRRVVMSCLVTEGSLEWQLDPVDDANATRITVHVDLPVSQEHMLGLEREILAESLHRLAELAARTAAP